MIDIHRVRRHCRKRALSAYGHFAQIVVVADTGEDHFGVVCGQLGRRAHTPGVRCGPARGFVGSPIVNRDIMPCAREMPGHRKPHDPETDKSDFAHAELPRD